LGPLRKFVFASIPVVTLWLVLEGGLRLAGVGSSLDREDPFVGFEAALPLFVLAEDESGREVYRTAANKRRFFNQQHFLREKPPATRRVFCLGGSTTYGRPYDDATSFCGWLRGALSLLEPETRWEVVNAGGISYASYRVAELMQELVAHEPDLFVVYTGHNEFLEERTYGALRDTPAWWRAIDRSLRGLRSYTVASRVLRPPEVLSGEVDARLDSSVGLDAYRRDDLLASAVEEHFRTNLERIVDTAERANAALLIVTPAGNLADCAPFKSEVSSELSAEAVRSFDASLEQGRDQLRAGDVDAALAALATAVRLDPRHAGARFEHARALLAAGSFAEAKREFVAARDEDVCPLRAGSRIVAISREVADARDVAQVDYPRVLAAASADAQLSPGSSWFLDHVHPTIEGHRLLARAVLERLHEIGWLATDPRTATERLDRLEAQAVANLSPERHGTAMRNLAKVLSWAGKTEEAALAAERALEFLPDDEESLFVLAIEASEWGEHARAIALLREVLWLDPDWLKPRVNLGVELSSMGRVEEAREQYLHVLERDPEHASARRNLANVLARMGRRDEAIIAYRESLAIDPDDAYVQDRLQELIGRPSRP